MASGASSLSFWFGPKILMRKALIPVMKEGRNSIDVCMLDLITADDHVDFQVFVMPHTDENYLRDVTSDIPDDDITNEVDSEVVNGMKEEVLDETFQHHVSRVPLL
ncbi:hypothetical protein CEP54_007922 [Fusarium duplospermum]|uniref:Uncharacterized protein n=1 Tax=Fusarium duplospermum TaxID=1325734 RepID=A0A428PYH8_9HYPO|nr:hypothetical protein CEP54_007922 [Fusarium duplospermum]